MRPLLTQSIARTGRPEKGTRGKTNSFLRALSIVRRGRQRHGNRYHVLHIGKGPRIMARKQSDGVPKCKACGFPMIMDETIIQDGPGAKSNAHSYTVSTVNAGTSNVKGNSLSSRPPHREPELAAHRVRCEGWLFALRKSSPHAAHGPARPALHASLPRAGRAQ